jgi:hypothetical protein
MAFLADRSFMQEAEPSKAFPRGSSKVLSKSIAAGEMPKALRR